MSASSGLLSIATWPAPGGWSGRKVGNMDHFEAMKTMAAEQYLLDELSPELRDAFEEHLFSCVECANDTLLGATFIDSAKAVLPTMTTSSATAQPRPQAKPKTRDWFAWLRPALVIPVFASLLAIIGYQNLVTYPELQLAATEPKVLPSPTVLHGDTRGGVPVVHADLVQGSTIVVELPQASHYASYRFDFYNSTGKLIWTRSVENVGTSEDTATIWLPGRVRQDSYKLALSGITSTGEVVAIQQQFFDLQIKK